MRFVVVSVTGYSLGGPMQTATSYSVLDSFDNYREIASFYVAQGGYGSSDITRHDLAHAEAARLEALYGDEA